MKKYIILIDDFKKVHLFDNNQSLHCFGPRYNLKQKYNTLNPSYYLEREDYREKHNLLTYHLSLEAMLHVLLTYHLLDCDGQWSHHIIWEFISSKICDCKDNETNKSMIKPYSRHA